MHRGVVMVMAAAGLADSTLDDRFRPAGPDGAPPPARAAARPQEAAPRDEPPALRDRPPGWDAPPRATRPPPRRAALRDSASRSPDDGWWPDEAPPPRPRRFAGDSAWDGPPPGARGEWGPPPGARGDRPPPGPRGEWGPPPGEGGPPPDGRDGWAGAPPPRDRRPPPGPGGRFAPRGDSAWTGAGPRRPPPGALERRVAAERERARALGLPGPPPRPDSARAAAAAGQPPRGPRRGPGPPERFELVAHQALARGGRVLGELAVVGPPAASPWAVPEQRRLLLTLPFALVVSLGAGLFMVRLLVRRLNALERVTDRLGIGAAALPAAAPGLDEIGRLEDRFNHMADRVVAARERLEETDRQRRQLLADISHELATPLTSIRGYVETLLDAKVPTTDAERTTYLNDVLEESKRLEAMIDELFELARLEAGATPLQRVRLDWAELARNTARRFEPRFKAAGLSLAWAAEPTAAPVLADGRRLEEVVDNLLSNALRYVPAGGHVTLALERVADRVRLTVADDGPGIAEADLPHVFERFYRAEATHALGGTGLGLAIVREIVRQHGGEVSARRREPHGAAFTVELPAGGA